MASGTITINALGLDEVKRLSNDFLVLVGALEEIKAQGCIDVLAPEYANEVHAPIELRDGSIAVSARCARVSGNPSDGMCPACIAKDALKQTNQLVEQA